MFFWHGIPLGVDFSGGTLVYVKFAHTPDESHIRGVLDRAGLHDVRIQRYNVASANEILIDLPQNETSATDVDTGKYQIIRSLETSGQDFNKDLNYIGFDRVRDALATADPLHAAGSEYDHIARQVLDYRDKQKNGVLNDFNELKQAGVPAAAVDALQKAFYISDFHVENAEIVGPQIGKQLRQQALLATLYSLLGMLV